MALNFSLKSQNYVFVLVDISKSVTQRQLTDAKQALNEVLIGSPLSKAFVTQGKQQDLVNFKLALGDQLSIVRFGSLNTTLSISPNPIQILNVNGDVNQVLNRLIWSPTDNQTYITLAKAKIAEYAKSRNIVKYKLYIISDNVNDDYGPNGIPNYPDEYTRNLAEGYNTTNNPVNESGYTKIKFEASSLFTLSFTNSVDVSRYNVPGGSSLIVPPDTLQLAPTIKLTSFADGKKDKPKSTNSNTFTISWNCNCPVNTKFNIQLSEVDGGSYKDKKEIVNSNSVKFSDVPSGKFRIAVTAINAKTGITFVETPADNFSWVIFLLIFLVAIGVGYYFWNKKRQEKIDAFSSKKDEDIFSRSSNNSSTNNSSSNSDYF